MWLRRSPEFQLEPGRVVDADERLAPAKHLRDRPQVGGGHWPGPMEERHDISHDRLARLAERSDERGVHASGAEPHCPVARRCGRWYRDSVLGRKRVWRSCGYGSRQQEQAKPHDVQRGAAAVVSNHSTPEARRELALFPASASFVVRCRKEGLPLADNAG